MRALTFHGRCDVRCETVPDPAIEAPDDALVEVRLSGICGSDLHPYHERERGLDAGTVMGHEFAGVVVETGPAVRGIARGDRVASPFTTSCGRCFYCRSGLTSRCAQGQLFGWVARGVGLQGGQAGLVRVPLADTTLVRIPEGVDDTGALLAGDVLSTGYYCALNAGVGPGTVVAVVGCGPVGLMAIVAARELGVERPFALDTVAERRSMAERFGAVALDAGTDDAVARVAEATAGRGADAVLEAVGSAAAGRLAWELVRPGGTISVVGVHTEPRIPFSPAEAYDKNLTLKVGRCPARSMIERVLPLLGEGRPDVTSIVSHRLPLAEGPQGYEMFDRKLDGCTKVVLTP